MCPQRKINFQVGGIWHGDLAWDLAWESGMRSGMRSGMGSVVLSSTSIPIAHHLRVVSDERHTVTQRPCTLGVMIRDTFKDINTTMGILTSDDSHVFPSWVERQRREGVRSAYSLESSSLVSSITQSSCLLNVVTQSACPRPVALSSPCPRPVVALSSPCRRPDALSPCQSPCRPASTSLPIAYE
jgi:hypothetical protein